MTVPRWVIHLKTGIFKAQLLNACRVEKALQVVSHGHARGNKSFDFSNYDVVLSDASAFAKSYCAAGNVTFYRHTPTRYLWSDAHTHATEVRVPRIACKFLPLALNYLRVWIGRPPIG